MSITEIKSWIETLDAGGQRTLQNWIREWEWRRRNPKDCFVIMPFSMTRDGRSADYWTGFFEHFLQPSLEQCGYRARRSQATQDNIICAIMKDLAWTDLVVGVLTDFNPNVWYELGVRHSLNRGGTLMICRETDIPTIPFDLKHHGVVPSSDSLAIDSFVEKLRLQLARIGDGTNDSPVSDFLNSGLFYCINRATAGRRSAMETLRRFAVDGDETAVLEAVDRVNLEWQSRDMQITLFKDDKVLRHADKTIVGTPGDQCAKDTTMNNQSLYPWMKSQGDGLRLGTIQDYPGRLTALAFDTLAERRWLVLVEAHLRQGGL